VGFPGNEQLEASNIDEKLDQIPSLLAARTLNFQVEPVGTDTLKLFEEVLPRDT
jgi:hypothetical protein